MCHGVSHCFLKVSKYDLRLPLGSSSRMIPYKGRGREGRGGEGRGGEESGREVSRGGCD